MDGTVVVTLARGKTTGSPSQLCIHYHYIITMIIINFETYGLCATVAIDRAFFPASITILLLFVHAFHWRKWRRKMERRSQCSNSRLNWKSQLINVHHFIGGSEYMWRRLRMWNLAFIRTVTAKKKQSVELQKTILCQFVALTVIIGSSSIDAKFVLNLEIHGEKMIPNHQKRIFSA